MLLLDENGQTKLSFDAASAKVAPLNSNQCLVVNVTSTTNENTVRTMSVKKLDTMIGYSVKLDSGKVVSLGNNADSAIKVFAALGIPSKTTISDLPESIVKLVENIESNTPGGESGSDLEPDEPPAPPTPDPVSIVGMTVTFSGSIVTKIEFEVKKGTETTVKSLKVSNGVVTFEGYPSVIENINNSSNSVKTTLNLNVDCKKILSKYTYTGSSIANVADKTLSASAWYKYNHLGFADWGRISEDWADKLDEYYGLAQNPNGSHINLSWAPVAGKKELFNWQTIFLSDDGRSVYKFNPYGASAICGGVGFGTHEVGKLRPDEYGLYDLCGNVAEWTGSFPQYGIGGDVKCNCAGLTMQMMKDNFTNTSDFKKPDFTGLRVWRNNISNLNLTGKEELVTIGNLQVCKYMVTKDLWNAIMSSENNVLEILTNPSSNVVGTERTFTVTTGFDDDGVPVTESITLADALNDNENDNYRPVENITMYDAKYFCNLYSASKGLEPYYTIESPVVENGHIVGANITENDNGGFRLPTVTEWITVASGSKNNNLFPGIRTGDNGVTAPSGFVSYTGVYKTNEKENTEFTLTVVDSDDEEITLTK